MLTHIFPLVSLNCDKKKVRNSELGIRRYRGYRSERWEMKPERAKKAHPVLGKKHKRVENIAHLLLSFSLFASFGCKRFDSGNIHQHKTTRSTSRKSDTQENGFFCGRGVGVGGGFAKSDRYRHKHASSRQNVHFFGRESIGELCVELLEPPAKAWFSWSPPRASEPQTGLRSQ